MTSLNLRRYAPWQFRDFAREKGIALLLVGALMGFTVIVPIRAFGRPIDAPLAKVLLVTILQQVAFILALISLNGVVSSDRAKGHYRFLFSKPVSVPAYYAQNFVVYFIGFLVSTALLIALFAVFVHPVSPIRPLIFCGFVFLSLGGIGFLISTLVRFDWAALVAVFLVSSVGHAMWQGEEGWRHLVISVLPPLNRVAGALPDIMERGTINTNDMLWILGYNAVCFTVGMLILRRRPFA